jgi:hypothetical protein
MHKIVYGDEYHLMKACRCMFGRITVERWVRG